MLAMTTGRTIRCRRLHQQGGLRRPSWIARHSAESYGPMPGPNRIPHVRRSCAARWRGRTRHASTPSCAWSRPPERELIVAVASARRSGPTSNRRQPSRVRMLRERGMQAAGRDSSGQARTVSGFLYREIGPDNLRASGRARDGMLFDTRVLFDTSAGSLLEGRFPRNSSVPMRSGRRAARFTSAARRRAVPAVLGGPPAVRGSGRWSRAGVRHPEL